MTFLVDANVIVYAAVESEYRDACLQVLEEIIDGADGRTSPAVLEEVWHIERSGRLGDLGGLTKRAYEIFAPLLPVTDRAFAVAIGLSERSVGRLGANDRLHVATCLTHDVDAIVTADRGFDGVADLTRVDPLDADAWHELLASA